MDLKFFILFIIATKASTCVNYLLKITSKIKRRAVLFKRRLSAIGNITLLIDTKFLRG